MPTTQPWRPPFPGAGVLSHVGCRLIQPVLDRIVRNVARKHPALFARLGEHQRTAYLIDPVELPFALLLRPDPQNLSLRAVPRDATPEAGAIVRGKFLLLLKLIDAGEDGDSAFFSRDLDISGNTEAVVRLRNALDDLDGSIAGDCADMFGAPGRMILGQLRKTYGGAHARG